MNIYYLIPDVFKKNLNFKQLIKSSLKLELLSYVKKEASRKDKVYGGIKVLYDHYKLLNKLGFNVHLVRMGDFSGNQFYDDIPVITYETALKNITSNDFVIATEIRPYDAFKFQAAKKIVFVQGWSTLDIGLKPKDLQKSYSEVGFDYVWSCSEYIKDFLFYTKGQKSFLIPNYIDKEIFYSSKCEREKNRVLALSRKNYSEMLIVKSILARFDSSLSIEFVDGLKPHELADKMRHADIFLSSGYPEGFGLPPLEAMHCGCVIVGYDGRGGREYMQDNVNSLIAPDGDVVEVAKKLKQLECNQELKETLRKNASESCLRYSMENTARSLEHFFSIEVA